VSFEASGRSTTGAGRPSSGGRRTIVAVAPVRRHRSGGLSVPRRPARRRFSSDERFAHVCSTAVPSLKRSLNTKDKGPQAKLVMPRSFISLALRSTAAPGHWGRAGIGFAHAAGDGAFGHHAQMQVLLMREAVLSTVRPNPSVDGTHNGGARLLASAKSAAPSCAPHVKR
jgi:hypothetical protein